MLSTVVAYGVYGDMPGEKGQAFTLHSELHVGVGVWGGWLGLAGSLVHHYILQVWRATDLYLALKW